MRLRLRSESGQSTTELAMMMPIIFGTFFFAFQVNILMQGYHQAAYASFMAARSFEIKHTDGDGDGVAQEVMKSILTGKVFTESEQGPASVTSSKRKDSAWGQKDGATVTVPGFQSLPYVRNIPGAPLNFSSKVPTHLGPVEWNKDLWGDEIREQETSGKACQATDNNLRDTGCHA